MMGYPIWAAASRAPWIDDTATEWAAGMSISRNHEQVTLTVSERLATCW